MSKSERVLFPTPVSAVKGAICFTCYKATTKLNRCSGCRRVCYCSAECQKKDWRRGHKQLCPVLQGINALDSPKQSQTWEEYRDGMWTRVSAFRTQKAKFTVNDERVLQYQPYCIGCHLNAFQLPTGSTLKLCPKCQIAAHCSSCDLSLHDSVCSDLREVMTAERFAVAHYTETGEPSLSMPTGTPRTTYLPISTASSWYDYYTKISDKQMVEGLLSHDLKPLAGNDEMASALRAATEKMSMMISIIAGLEAVYPDLGTKEKVDLHLIGANAKELDALMLFEELLHLLPCLKEVNCSFVGLELPNPMDAGGRIVLDCCPECTKQKKVRSIEMHKGAYHDFAKSPAYKKPDLAVAFQTGHSQECVDDWTPTIRYLVHAPHCTMFTTFNEKEMVEEIEILKKLDAKFLVDGEKNKWQGMRPLLEVIEETENSVYYNHQYWYVVQGLLVST
ncbi:uncharacterized protein LY89DRAFT_607800 [Mollisia scopiformis]|uniref:MYND-type domain-containing protein n=1 Tax=Mollisia scopiformis TaxID=149040 RepID=A0A194XRT7_MOLSC|nr:uncharacterized protein LY89DRAFT_607800 [Mollisia scopiformis]KUJ22908.1 hypothetical protein LY89DRAFT_607800 [Mollisia scopiformis]